MEEKERGEQEIDKIMANIQDYDSDISSGVEEINPVNNPSDYEYDIPSFNIKTELTDLFPEEFDREELVIKRRHEDSEVSDTDLIFN